MKQKRCEENGLVSRAHVLPAATTETALLELIASLNADPGVHGILVQVPLPGHINEMAVLSAVAPQKDVDCFHPQNVGLLSLGAPAFQPCTPAGVIALLDYYAIPLVGQRAVIIGRSNIVGKPLAALLLARHATVTVCHSRTIDLPAVAREADILVAAIGKPAFVTEGMVKPGAVVIDVGINRVDDAAESKGYRIVGDVDFDAVARKASWITPVPGGVGAMTIPMLLMNCLRAFRLQHG
jgi:methylenetetrahydrofolate dehydrogenase (NADP+)/methenyltetrahydrofolate cyclohydrolase